MLVETSSLIALLLAAAAAGALLAVLVPWRRLVGAGHTLPVWGFLARRGASADGRQALQAEIRCGMCEAQAQCRALLARGVTAPPAGCPNGRLFKR